MPDAPSLTAGAVEDGPGLLDGAALVGIVLTDDYEFDPDHDTFAALAAFEVAGAGYARPGATARVERIDGVWKVFIDDMDDVDLSDVDNRGGIFWGLDVSIIDAEIPARIWAPDPGGAINPYHPTWDSGIVEFPITPITPRVTALEARTVAGVAASAGDYPAAALAEALAALLGGTPAGPTVGSVGLLASHDYRPMPDGAIPNVISPVDAPPYPPATNGPGTRSIPMVDPTGFAPSAPLAVSDGALYAPEAPTAETAAIPTYVVATPATATYRSTIGLADPLNQTGSPDGAGVNITITNPTGTGPVGHCSVFDTGSGVVTKVKIGLDFEGTVIVDETHAVLTDHVLGEGDRAAVHVDPTARSWSVEVNDETLLTLELVDDGSGGENLVVDGDVIGNIETPLDFDAIFVSSTPTSRADADGWVCGTRWWAWSVDQVDLDSLTVTGTDWARLVEQARGLARAEA